MSIDRYKSILETVLAIEELKSSLHKEKRKLDSLLTISESKGDDVAMDLESFGAAVELVEGITFEVKGHDPSQLCTIGGDMIKTSRKGEILSDLYKLAKSD